MNQTKTIQERTSAETRKAIMNLIAGRIIKAVEDGEVHEAMDIEFYECEDHGYVYGGASAEGSIYVEAEKEGICAEFCIVANGEPFDYNDVRISDLTIADLCLYINDEESFEDEVEEIEKAFNSALKIYDESTSAARFKKVVTEDIEKALASFK